MSRPRVDWSAGHYEHIAAGLLPAAEVAVDHAAPAPGERVLDIGCGTGNAALLAAERGAQVTGIDPAERLLAVARLDALARGLTAEFVLGVAGELPFADGCADVVLSVFGVTFAPDAAAAAAEIARVTSNRGRFSLCAWIPEGAMAAVAKAGREAMSAASGETPAGPPPFGWHDADALVVLFGRHGFSIELREHSLAFTAASPREFIDSEFRDHPLWVAGRGMPEAGGRGNGAHDRALAILEAANEDPSAFRVTSRYVVAIGRRG